MNNTIYEISDELLNEQYTSDFFQRLGSRTAGAGGEQDKDTTKPKTQPIKPNVKLTLNKSNLTSAYTDMRNILFNLFFKRGQYKTEQSLRNKLFNEIDKIIFKPNIKGNEIFIKLNEQQKPKFVPRVTFDISSILKNQNLNKEQDEEISTILNLWIEELVKKYNGQKLNESKDITPIHINFTKTKQLNESFLLMFGTAIKMILQRMFGQDVYVPPMTISGNKQQMETFINALAGEKRYFDSYVRYGLNDPRTYQDRYKLQAAVNDFERNTGIKWPFK